MSLRAAVSVQILDDTRTLLEVSRSETAQPLGSLSRDPSLGDEVTDDDRVEAADTIAAAGALADRMAREALDVFSTKVTDMTRHMRTS